MMLLFWNHHDSYFLRSFQQGMKKMEEEAIIIFTHIYIYTTMGKEEGGGRRGVYKEGEGGG